MSGFEILLLLIFILFPLLQAILGKGQKTGPPKRPGSPRPGVGDRTGGAEEPEDLRASQANRDGPTSAADMIPEDLWAILTGEPRPGTRRSPSTPPSPWSDEPDPRPASAGPEPWLEAPAAEPARPDTSWSDALDRDEYRSRPAPPEPVSLEYVGPEAITLETLPPEPEIRQAAFHARLHATEPDSHSPVHRAALRRWLRRPGGLRRAVVLAEILGPPRGAAGP